MEQRTVMGKTISNQKSRTTYQIYDTFGTKVKIYQIPRRETRTGQRYGAGSIMWLCSFLFFSFNSNLSLSLIEPVSLITNVVNILLSDGHVLIVSCGYVH